MSDMLDENSYEAGRIYERDRIAECIKYVDDRMAIIFLSDLFMTEEPKDSPEQKKRTDRELQDAYAKWRAKRDAAEKSGFREEQKET
jgi:hypothetical protein